MNIGEVVKVFCVLVKMICYYEQIGLIFVVDCIELGYWVYFQVDIYCLCFICCVCDFGFQVVEISELLGLWNDIVWYSVDVKYLVEQYIVDLE